MGVQKYGVLSKWQNIERKNYHITALSVDATLRDNKKIPDTSLYRVWHWTLSKSILFIGFAHHRINRTNDSNNIGNHRTFCHKF
jgi:hypothetical protein